MSFVADCGRGIPLKDRVHKGNDSDHYFISRAAVYFSLFAEIVDDWILALERS